VSQHAAYERFMASTNIDYERWHEGEGYDLEALRSLADDERETAERWLLDRAANDWRDLEGLLALGTERSRQAVIDQLRHGSTEQRLWAARFLTDDPDAAATDPTFASDRDAAVVEGLGSALLYYGLTQALDLAVEVRSPAMVAALWRATQREENEAAIHAAARLAYLYGKATSDFDWDLRPLFLRFGTTDAAERAAATTELGALCGVDPAAYITA
jgi:hypothetical protein